MKKFMAILLVLALASLMGLSAMADPVVIDELPGDQDIEVKGTFAPGEVTHVYSVDVSWGDMEFIYTSPAQTWDPATHTYTTSGGGWAAVENSNTVTVANHSDLPVDVAFEFDAEEGFGATVDTGEFGGTLASAVGTAVESAPSVTATVTDITGTLASGQTNVTIGTVTVTLGEAE